MAWQFDNSIPIYLQIIQEMKRRMIRRELLPGEKLPSIRDLSKEAGVNPNTLQRALTELENMGLIETERTSGKFVTEDVKALSRLREDYLSERLHPLLHELRTFGLEEEEIHTFITLHYKEDRL